MKERGMIMAEVIWVKILLHAGIMLKDSLSIPKNPKNWISSCSLSMILETGGCIRNGDKDDG